VVNGGRMGGVGRSKGKVGGERGLGVMGGWVGGEVGRRGGSGRRRGGRGGVGIARTSLNQSAPDGKEDADPPEKKPYSWKHKQAGITFLVLSRKK